MLRGALTADRGSPLSGVCSCGYHWLMVDNALLQQVMKLDADSRLELRDAIEASVVSEYLTPELSEILAERVAEDDAADHADYVTIEELERQTLAHEQFVERLA